MKTTGPRDKAKLEARLRHTFEVGVAFNRVIGVKIASFDPEAPKLRFDMKPDLIGNPRRQILHGGVISAVLDVTAGFAIHIALAHQENEVPAEGHFPNMGTIGLHVDYLRPGRGKFFISTGKIVRLGSLFLRVAALFQLADGAQAIGAGALRGMHDTRVPMLFAAVGYWVVGIGIGTVLAFPLHMEGVGIWIGLASGLAVVAVLILTRWTMRERLMPPPQARPSTQ